MSKQLTLGITKIGDLLLANRITRDEHNNPIQGVQLTVPEYQRPYKWTAKNANQLLDDIIGAKNENKEVYRIGTLILHVDEKKDNIYNIVDGQQRIITFTLLLKAMGETEINFLKQGLSNNQYNAFNVLNNYRGFKRRVMNMKDEKEKGDLLDYIKNNCELIVVSTGDISEAFQFFDSQNARGKKLYPHDLLKAYHLREMNNLDVSETERIVKIWEDMNQKDLANLFQEYLYRMKEWIKGNRSYRLDENNMRMFKGVTKNNNYPYAKFYKGAYAYADYLNQSSVPFVTGMVEMNPFQIDTTIIAGKTFFEYAKHYFDVLADIRNNDKYEGYFINDNDIVKTLNNRKYRNGVGNGIARKMFDTVILLYVDRFCSVPPSKVDSELLDQFVVYAFVWAYSMRAQYKNVGWQVAENYIMGTSSKGAINSFNIYKVIAEADSPIVVLNCLSDKVQYLPDSRIVANKDGLGDKENGAYINYLDHFKENGFWKGDTSNE
ncbi:MAG TPA: DUF262 domain-containing protein [Candidatus Merdenecus merdavium]|nr:DUF262 domain-containing protein [Candidatus Merdenecus merdavium]